jgi:hypothetical protein
MQITTPKTVAAVRVAFWLALGFSLFMAWNPHPPDVMPLVGDRFRHMTAFATLTVLRCAGWREEPLVRIGVGLSLIGALVEVVQAIPALHRDCDVIDWVVDTVAILGVLAVVIAARRPEA